MPCSKYSGSQRRLCFATKEWKDWSKIKKYHNLDYCPRCHRRTEHIKVMNIKLCKTCGKQERY